MSNAVSTVSASTVNLPETIREFAVIRDGIITHVSQKDFFALAGVKGQEGKRRFMQMRIQFGLAFAAELNAASLAGNLIPVRGKDSATGMNVRYLRGDKIKLPEDKSAKRDKAAMAARIAELEAKLAALSPAPAPAPAPAA